MKFSTLLSAVAALSFSASAANAAITFDFTGVGADRPTNMDNVQTGAAGCNGFVVSSGDLCTIDNGRGFDFEQSTITLNAVGLANDVAVTLQQDLAPADASGLAVLSPGEVGADDQIQVRSGESIRFTATDSAVPGGVATLIAVDFNNGVDTDCADSSAEGPCGNFTLLVDGVAVLENVPALDDMMLAGFAGTVFEFIAVGVPGQGDTENSGFTIGTLTFDQDLSVPVPAALPLLLSGVAGLGFASRRRRKSIA